MVLFSNVRRLHELSEGSGSSCDEMFYGCTNLNYVKALFTDEPSDGATNYWLFDVSPIGTFVKSKEVKWDVRGASGIPEGWTVVTE